MNALDTKLTRMGLIPTPGIPVVTQGSEGGRDHYPIDVYPEKHETRQDTLKLLRNGRRTSRLWYDGHLTCAWAEICGGAPDSTGKYLLEEGMLTSEAPFIGINLDQAIIDANREAFAEAGDRTRWICGTLESIVTDLENPDLKNVGVLVFDAFYSPVNTNLRAILNPVFAFAKAQFDRLGQFVLVINQTLRGRKGRPLEVGCRQYEEVLEKHFGLRDIPDSAYTIYTSRRARMRVLRLVFG